MGGPRAHPPTPPPHQAPRPPPEEGGGRECRSVCGETSRVTPPARSAALTSTAHADWRRAGPAGVEEERRRAVPGRDQLRPSAHGGRPIDRVPAYDPTGTIRSLLPLPRSSTVPSTGRGRRRRGRPPRRSGRRCRRAPRAGRGRAAPAWCRGAAASRIASTSASGSAFGSRFAGRGGFTAAGRVGRDQPVADRELVEPAHRDHRAAPPRSSSAAGGRRRPRAAAPGTRTPSASETPSEVVDADAARNSLVAAQVAPVRRQRVGRQPALDREVVEVGADGDRDRRSPLSKGSIQRTPPRCRPPRRRARW